jgi:integrase
MKGTVRKRGDSWQWQHPAPPGWTKKYVVGTAKLKRDAERALSASLAECAQGRPVEPSKQLATRYLDEWLAVRKLSVKPSTFRSDADIVRLHLAPALQGVKLVEVSGRHIGRLYTALRQKGLDEKTLQNIHVCRRRTFAEAVKARLILANPFDEIPRPKPAPVAMTTWSADQLRQFLDATTDHRLGAVFRFSAMTAMRRGEVLGLGWQDVDLDAGQVSVRNTRTSVAHKVEEGTPKTRRATRVVDLDAETVTMLKRWRKIQLQNRLAWGPAWVDNGLVFTREDGTGWHPQIVSDDFDSAVKRSGLPKIRFHDLRHTWATLALTGHCCIGCIIRYGQEPGGLKGSVFGRAA